MRYNAAIHNQDELDVRLGPYITMNESLTSLDEVETFILQQMETYQTDVTFDKTASEPPFFNTISYTVFAGGISLRPLQPYLTEYQGIAAINDNFNDRIDYVSYFADRINNDTCNLYNEVKPKTDYACEAVVALPGSNKLYSEVCYRKLQHILKEHGKLAVYKHHPVTNDEDIKKFKEAFHKIITIADKDDDLYHYVKKASVVYTTHSSESAMYAVALGKQISPIDTYQSVKDGSFYHISKHLFLSDNPQKMLNKILASPKSGVVFPSIQDNWQERIVAYLDYIHELRNKVKYQYV